MKFKSISIAFVTLAVASITNAQTLFHDDWESYRPGTQDWDALYSFGDFDIDLDAGERYPTVVEGPKDGVSPYSGNQMYDFRGSAIKGGRALAKSVNSNSTVNPTVDMSFRFAVSSAFAMKTSLLFGVNTSSLMGGQDASGSALFDLDKSTFKGFGVQPKPLSLHRDVWNELRFRVDWKNKKTSIFLNWLLIDSHTFVTTSTPPPYSILGVYFGVIANANYASQFPIDKGIPGMLVDDIRFEAVPELKTDIVLIVGTCALLVTRRRNNA